MKSTRLAGRVLERNVCLDYGFTTRVVRVVPSAVAVRM